MNNPDKHIFYEFTEHLNIYPSYTVQYNKSRRMKRSEFSDTYFEDTSTKEKQQQSQPQKFYYDYLSTLSAKKVRRCVEWMYLFSPLKYVPPAENRKAFHFRLNFITLTLSSAQKNSDQWITEHMLQPFLKWMSRQYNANNYIWKAEIQNNGNIHYHITTNKFIPAKNLQAKWNSIQNKNGYVQHHPVTLEVYNPPSTEVKAVKNEKELGKYLGGYYSKKDEYCKVKQGKQSKYATLSDIHQWKNHFYQSENYIAATKYEGAESVIMKRVVHGRLWSCSESLSNLKCFINEKDSDYLNAKEDFLRDICEKEISIDFAKVYIGKITINTPLHKLITDKLTSMYQKFNAHDN